MPLGDGMIEPVSSPEVTLFLPLFVKKCLDSRAAFVSGGVAKRSGRIFGAERGRGTVVLSWSWM